MDAQLRKRDETQPTRNAARAARFATPQDFPAQGADDTHELKAWKVIDDAACGCNPGGAQMSEKHSNFMINTGGASAADLEGLGELVRKRVFQNAGIELYGNHAGWNHPQNNATQVATPIIRPKWPMT